MKNKSDNLFLIIGAQRSGTTYLYTILYEHPEICMAKPLKPEPKFFLSNNYNKGKDFYFNKYFSHKNNNHKVFIEKSTSYYEFKEVPQRLISEFANTKIIFIIRNPVERALSNYFFSKNNKLETRSIENVFLHKTPAPEYPKTISTNPFDYLERGNYIKYIKMYLQYIPKENFNVLFFNDIIGNITEVQKLYKKLNISVNFVPNSLTKKINNNENKNTVSVKIISKLNKYYEPYNKELENFLTRKIF